MCKLPAIAPVLALAAACSAGAQQGDEHGGGAQRSFEVGAFERIALEGSHDVVVTVGGAPSVRAEGHSDALERLEIGVENGELRIASRSGSWSWFGRHHRGVTVHVTVPSLTAASVAGSGDMRVNRVEGQRFAAVVTGSGELDLPNLRVAEASFSVTGSGGIRGAGAAQRSNASLTGSGDISVRATGTASVNLRGSGDVTVVGPARCTISKSGSGDVRCGG